MNRKERRAAAKKERDSRRAETEPAPAPLTYQAPLENPGFLWRLMASIMLSSWVVNRVRRPNVERVLAMMAMQAGRPEVAANIVRRQEMRAKAMQRTRG